ncbi:MAG: malto-oligosyltrehalose trehalohydrolase, partial [Candidatus Margulisbacteria bacterium]|nr:malto-oligosyltrehalose trehalohydrolase [Candidatus Margulisiibacteriota bacterium]
ELKKLGVNTIELMPVAQFPGKRNWGYDGTCPFSVQNSYGGPGGFKTLVNEAHQAGLAVILDVVYNHLGPEGNYLAEFGPYFTSKYVTPWGKAVNFDDKGNGGVRNYFIQNSRHWFDHYHIDALRLDAIHGIFDQSKKHILRELSEKTDRFSKSKGRKFYLIAESDLNQERVVRDRSKGGYGVHAQWNDDFHHALHTILTGEKKGYYQDFGKIEQLEKAYGQGFVYSGQYSAYREKRHGTSSKNIPASRLVVFTQNHDQVGNRLAGERLSQLVSFEALKLAAGAMLVAPYIPLLFMGEEYAENIPFYFFVDFGDPGLIKAVREGRQKEFSAFGWDQPIPDPQVQKTFDRSKIDWRKRNSGKHQVMLKYYQRLLSLRRDIPALSHLSKKNLKVSKLADRTILLERWHLKSRVWCIMNFGKEIVKSNLPKKAVKIMDSSDTIWSGPGALEKAINPLSLVLYEVSK